MSCKHDIDTPDIDTQLMELIASTSPDGTVDHYILPRETDYDAIPQDPRNPLTQVKVDLGQMLFHETGLAVDAFHTVGLGTYSCASCHVADRGFRPGRAQGIADGGIGFGEFGEDRQLNGGYAENQIDAQGIRPLSVLNTAFVSNTLWNGQFGAGGLNIDYEEQWRNNPETVVNALGYEAMESQNIDGVTLHRMDIDQELADELGYKELFDLSFPEFAVEERYSKLTLALALSAYLRSLTTSEADFQHYLRGDVEALTPDEKEGASLFFAKAGCVRCHNGPNLGGDSFHAVGAKDLWQHPDALFTSVDDKKNLGRGSFTGAEEDMRAFRVPQLYNQFGNEHFLHGSSKSNVREVVEYFNAAIPENDMVSPDQLSPFFTPLNLSDEEIDQLTVFIEKALYDHELDRYLPVELPSGNCFPNADVFSQWDLGCR